MITIAWNKSLLINIWVLIFLISSIGITSLRKGLLEDGLIMSLKKIVRMLIFVFGVKHGSSLRPSSPLLSYMVVYIESHE